MGKFPKSGDKLFEFEIDISPICVGMLRPIAEPGLPEFGLESLWRGVEAPDIRLVLLCAWVLD